MSSARVNLAVATEDMIRIEKECDKLGISRAQFIKQAIHEKLKDINNKDEQSDIQKIKEDVNELKKIILLLLEKKVDEK